MRNIAQALSLVKNQFSLVESIKNNLKCDSIVGGIVYGITQPIFSSFALYKPHKKNEEPGIENFNIIKYHIS